MRHLTINRREFLLLTGSALGGALLAPQVFAQLAPGMASGLVESNLVYLTPLRSDGSESACQAELWFVADGAGVYVVTAHDAWRARAVTRGLTQARVWVGDVGVWTRSNGTYRALPQMEAEAAFVTDPAEHARLLEIFGAKYSMVWLIWRSRFRNGLADGSRVMLRYQPISSAGASSGR